MRIFFVGLMLASLVAFSPANAQKISTETRVDTLEKQVKALQRRVFQTADGQTLNPEITASETGTTAGGIPASGVDYLGRITTLEMQLAEITNRQELTENKVGKLETSLKATNDRVALLEKRIAALEAGGAAVTAKPDTNDSSSAAKSDSKAATDTGRAGRLAKIKKQSTGDKGEDAYMYGYNLWEGQFYPEARTQLKAVVSKYPSHRRASYAQNLLGRAWMDEGNYADASQAFFDSYKKFPKGERAPDSLYYLGQSLEKLKEPTRACEAYKEFDAVYGATASADLKGKVVAGKRSAKCT